MVVVNKSIQVDFTPGENIKNAIKDAMSMAAFTRRPVKFKFNDIPMTIDPHHYSMLCYKFDISPKEGCIEDIRKRVDYYLEEYNDKVEKRDRRFFKTLHKKETK